MTKGNFYFLSDEYCDRFSKYGVMANKETAADGLHRRPCFYSIQDIKNPNIYWMVPISSQIAKYQKILKQKQTRYKVIDAKAKKIMNKYYQGTKIVITDLDYIFEHL